MAKLVFELNQSLDGYIDHREIGRPSPVVFRHFLERFRNLKGMIYGRRTYEVMRYWDHELPDWNQDDREFAAAWRSKPKWVVAHSTDAVGPNATLVNSELEIFARGLKQQHDGEISVAGPTLAGSLTAHGLIDEYHIYLHPVVLGHGTPFFVGPRPRLRFVASDRIGEDVVRLTYASL